MTSLLFAALLAASPVQADSVRTYAVRLTPGEDPRAEIDRFARSKDIHAGWIVTCVGSLTHAVLRLANQPDTTSYDGHFEIVSLVGTFGAGGVHLHASLADSTGRVFGGHLELGSRIYTTAEIVLAEGKGLRFDREVDSVTTYHELRVRQE